LPQPRPVIKYRLDGTRKRVHGLGMVTAAVSKIERAGVEV
jgi:hypothetical protein